MKLYHGSNMRVCKPDLCYSKPYKDFGQGFYLSSDRQQAKELAVTKVAQMKNGEPIINSNFAEDCDDSRININKVRKITDNSRQFLTFVV